MEFKKYQHVERWETDEVLGIEEGECHIFFKIDGTNGSVWLSDGVIKAGSRNRELSFDNDNQGFYAHIYRHEGIKEFFNKHPDLRLYGEWLVPHAFKDYQEDAWRQFYVFDVCTEDGDYVPYSVYQQWLEECAIQYIPEMLTIKNPTTESLYRALNNSGQFLVKNGAGVGEGIVIKNYGFYNKYGRQTWAKIVTNEFHEKHKKANKPNVVSCDGDIETKIVEDLCTLAFIEKEYAKIAVRDGWSSKKIHELLGRVFYEFVKEETPVFVKKYKNPTINFKRLQTATNLKVKTDLKHLF